MFQAFHVLPHLSVADNVALPLLLLGRPDAARVQAVLGAVGLAGLGERLPQQLSGGQLPRVAIARAVVHRPRLILADEPTGNLDPGTAERMMDVLAAEVRHEGAACVLVTHSAAAGRADRVLRLTPQGLQDDCTGALKPPRGDAWPTAFGHELSSASDGLRQPRHCLAMGLGYQVARCIRLPNLQWPDRNDKRPEGVMHE